MWIAKVEYILYYLLMSNCNFLYTVWLRDNEAEPNEDQDYEWPACFIIEAASSSNARKWGDQLAISYCKRTSNSFIESKIEDLKLFESNNNIVDAPRIKYGYEATDDELGW